MKNIILYSLLYSACYLLNVQSLQAQGITPEPKKIIENSGSFVFTAKTTIFYQGAQLKKIAQMLREDLKKETGFGVSLLEMNTQPAAETETTIYLGYGRNDYKIPGAYALIISKNSVQIEADNNEGIFYGYQSLLQLIQQNFKMGNYSIPCMQVFDEPRFAYRGVHLDVSRHFFDVDYVKKYIDYLAAYKYNTFHWHLTDDQGWRIEIKKYPLLTKVGGYRNGTIIGHYPGKGNDSLRYGGFYTQDQIKDVVKYAADRYITIVPEIEMPGHASAAIAAYPQLSCFPAEDTKIKKDQSWAGSRKGKQVQQTWGIFEDVFAPTEYTFSFLENVLDEVMQLFPGKYIHIGGDECPKASWKRSAFSQKLIKDKGLKDEHGLQSYFVQRIEKYVNSKGKKIIGWDEIMEGGIAPNATIMSWRGEDGGIAAAKQDHDVIMTPSGFCYLDHSQLKKDDSLTIGGYTPVSKVYSYNPVPDSLTAAQGKHILGAQINVWTEYIGNTKKLEYMIFPRLIAFSEVLWSNKEIRNWKKFEEKLPAIKSVLKKEGINYCDVVE